MSLRFAEPNHPVNKFTRPSNVLLILVAALWFGFLPGSSLANALDPTRSAAVHSGDFVRIPGHVLPALAKATIVPSKSETDTQLVTLTLVLKRDDQPGFEHFLHGLYDPKSPKLSSLPDAATDRRRLRPQPRGLRFCLSLDDLEGIQSRARLGQPPYAHDAWYSRRCRARIRCENWRLRS